MCDTQQLLDLTMSESAASPAGSGAPSGPVGRLQTTPSRQHTMSPPPANKENVEDGHVPPEPSWILPEGQQRCQSPVGRFPCNGWCRTMHDEDEDEDEVKADVISLASCKDSQLSWDDEKGQSMTSVRFFEFLLGDIVR